jgi:hypothetical protein
MRPYGSTETGIRGGDENCYESEAHAWTGIFANAFADQWKSQQNDPGSEEKWVRSEIIQHIIDLCGFSADSLMMHYMDQQQWYELEHVVRTALDEIKDFVTFRDKGITYERKTYDNSSKKLRTFLLFYKRKTLWEEEGPTEDDVLGWTLHEFNAYYKSKEFQDGDA